MTSWSAAPGSGHPAGRMRSRVKLSASNRDIYSIVQRFIDRPHNEATVDASLRKLADDDSPAAKSWTLQRSSQLLRSSHKVKRRPARALRLTYPPLSILLLRARPDRADRRAV